MFEFDWVFLAGEVSLPGRKTDKEDADDIATALREAKEEIGLDPSLVEVVSVLDSFTNKRGMAVIPVIGILHDKKAFVPAPNAAEVEAIFDVPREMFLKDENRREEEREWMGDEYLLQYFDCEANDKKFVIWAITAGILIETATIVYQRLPAFLERRPFGADLPTRVMLSCNKGKNFQGLSIPFCSVPDIFKEQNMDARKFCSKLL